MGIISRLKSAGLTQVSFNPMDHEMVRRAFGGAVSTAGVMVNETSSQRLSAWWACKRILAESIGMLPWAMFRNEPSGSVLQIDDHWLHDVLVSTPNRDQTSVEFRETLTLNLTSDGNAYCFIDRTGDRITSLTPMYSSYVTPMRKRGTNTKLSLSEGEAFFRVNDRGVTEDFSRDKVWHTKLFGFDSLKGLSPLVAAAECLGGAQAQQEFANRFFGQGAMPSAVVTIPQWLNEDQKKQAQEAAQTMAGLGRAHQVALFQGGMKPEPWNTMNLEEMQLVLSRRFSVLEICRFHLVPPHRVYELEKGASYSSIEVMSQDFITNSLMPYFRKIEESISRWLLSPADQRKYFFRFNYEGMLRAASKERAEYEALLVDHGIVTRNEIRAKENYNRSSDKGMDSFTVQLAMTPIDKLGKEKAVPAAPVEMGDKSTTVNASVVLPDAMTHQIKTDSMETQQVLNSVVVATAGMVKTIRETSERVADGQAEIVSQQKNMQDAIRELVGAMKQVARESARPRKAVFNSKGEPIGTEPVDKLEFH